MDTGLPPLAGIGAMDGSAWVAVTGERGPARGRLSDCPVARNPHGLVGEARPRPFAGGLPAPGAALGGPGHPVEAEASLPRLHGAERSYGAVRAGAITARH